MDWSISSILYYIFTRILPRDVHCKVGSLKKYSINTITFGMTNVCVKWNLSVSLSFFFPFVVSRHQS